jgi:hypothetical protein
MLLAAGLELFELLLAVLLLVVSVKTHSGSPHAQSSGDLLLQPVPGGVLWIDLGLVTFILRTESSTNHNNCRSESMSHIQFLQYPHLRSPCAP